MKWFKRLLFKWATEGAETGPVANEAANMRPQGWVGLNPQHPAEFEGEDHDTYHFTVRKAENGNILTIRAYNNHAQKGTMIETRHYLVLEGASLVDQITAAVVAHKLGR